MGVIKYFGGAEANSMSKTMARSKPDMKVLKSIKRRGGY